MGKTWLFVVPVLAIMMLASAPPSSNWNLRTHGATYGTRGIAQVAFSTIVRDPNIPVEIKKGLEWNFIRTGAGAPDRWRQSPYYLDSGHTQTYVEIQGADYLENVERLQDMGVWDNVSYYLGIAAHYWGDVMCYAHHDNARLYYEQKYGPDLGYGIWDNYHHHLELQVKYYRPKDPALIVDDDGDEYTSLSDFIDAAKMRLDDFIYQTLRDSQNINNGYFGDWIKSRKIEETNYAVYANGNVDNVHYGSKELIDMSTELVYSGWIYALDNSSNNIASYVSADRITWEQWWSREHRTPGLTFYHKF